MVAKEVGRRRKTKNADLPLGLYSRKVRGKLRYFYRNEAGKDTYFPEHCPLSAIKQSVVEFNETNRNNDERIKSRADKYNVRVHKVLPKLKQNLDEENEGKSRSTLQTFDRDCERFIDFFGDYFTKEITLEDINEYLDEYHAGASICMFRPNSITHFGSIRSLISV